MPKIKAPLSANLKKYLSKHPSVFEIDGDVLFCKVCNKAVRCERKFQVDQHLRTTKHKELNDRRSEKTKPLITTSGEAYISADNPFSSIDSRVTWPAKDTDPLQPSSSTCDYAVHIKKPMSPDQDEYEDTRLDLQYSPEPSPVVGFKRKARVDSDSAAAAANDIDDAFCDALRSFKKLCETREERKGNEALHGFVQMIHATMSGMSTEKQTRAMLRVTEVVMQIKLESDG